MSNTYIYKYHSFELLLNRLEAIQKKIDILQKKDVNTELTINKEEDDKWNLKLVIHNENNQIKTDPLFTQRV